MQFWSAFELVGVRRVPRKPVIRSAKLSFEPQEERRLLAAAPVVVLNQDTGAVVAPLDTPQPESSSASDGPAPTEGDIILYRNDSPVETFSPAADTDADRGTALRTALAAAQPSDELVLGAFTYDVGGASHLDFPDGVTVSGAGKDSTKITSSCPQSVDGNATYTIHDGTVVQDCWLEGSLHNGLYQPLVGIQGDPDGTTTTYLLRDKITGDSDGIFLWTGNTYQVTIYAYDCDITTNYDAVAILGSGLNLQEVDLFNCTITVSQPDSIPAHISNCVNDRSGHVLLSNCTLTATGDANSVQTAGVFTYNQGSSTIEDCTFHVSSPAGIAYDLLIENPAKCFVSGGQGSGPNGTYIASSATQTPTNVEARYVFYNNSNYQGDNPDTANDDAIATDKTALLPGQTATFANVTSYDKGINGVMVDLAGIHGNITADDCNFSVGNNNSPSAWSAAPEPVSVTVRPGEGVGGSDRIELTWADGAITQKWLEVTVNATANTGLAANDVFFFGNEIGDADRSNTSTIFKVSALDIIGAQTHLATVGTNQPITNLFDYNRDGAVGSADITLDQIHFTTNSTGLVAIAISPAGPFAPLPSAAPAAIAPSPVPVNGGAVLTPALGKNTASPSSLLTETYPAWIANRLSDLDLNHGSLASYFERLAHVDTPNAKTATRAEADPVSQGLSLSDELLDRLVSRVKWR